MLAVHPGYLPTKMTGFYGTDDMEKCMRGLVSWKTFRVDESVGVESRSYVKGMGRRWLGEDAR